LAVCGSVILAILATVLVGASSNDAIASHAGGMDAMSIDMDPGAAPANTATSVGSIEQCARINENGIVDADEDAEDALEVDITAEGIPAYDDHGTNPPDDFTDDRGGIIGYQYTLSYSQADLTVESHDARFLLTGHPGSSDPFVVADDLPDGNDTGYRDADRWQSSAVDLSGSPPEDGSGVVERLNVSSEQAATEGTHLLGLIDANYVDARNEAFAADSIRHAGIAVNIQCGTLPPPTPVAPPRNDNLESALAAVNLEYLDFLTTEGATTQADEPSPCGGIAKTAWYKFQPTTSQEFAASSNGEFRTVLAVYNGLSIAELTPLGCDFSPSHYGARVPFIGRAGETYYIQLGGHQGTGGDVSFSLGATGFVPPETDPHASSGPTAFPGTDPNTGSPGTPIPGSPDHPESAGPGPSGGMDAMSIDMDPGAAPANTATSIGSIEQCARINENGIVDADEDAEDVVEVDITAQGIPPYSDNGTPNSPGDDHGGIIGFQHLLFYDENQFTIVSQDSGLLLSANQGSAPTFNVSEPLPDIDGSNSWLGAGLDTGTGIPEQGDGVIQRLTLSSDEGAAAEQYAITLDVANAVHLDTLGEAHSPDGLGFGNIALDQPCSVLVTPGPTPTLGPQTPGPTDPPYPPPNPNGSMDAMSIDLDPSTAPANSATSVGSIEQCARANENGLLDADEDSEDTLEIDITAEGVPLYEDGGTPGYIFDDRGGILGFQHVLQYDESQLTVVSANSNLLLNSNALSSAFDFSDPLPDVNANGYWMGAALDVGTGRLEDGSGVLQRITIATNDGAVATQNVLNFRSGDTGHFDGLHTYLPRALGLANIAVNQACGALVTPAPTPSPGPTRPPTPTPAPTPTRTPGPTQPPPPTPCCTPNPGPNPTPVNTPSGSAPAFSPGGLVCFENFDASDYHPDGSVRAANECDGDPAPAATSDLRVRTCVGWNDDCTVQDRPARDSAFDQVITFIPPSFVIKPGDQLPIGALTGQVAGDPVLGVLGYGCALPIHQDMTMLNGSTNLADTIQPRPVGSADALKPLAEDNSGNGIPDGADKYPRFLLHAFDVDREFGPDGIPDTADDIDGPAQPLRPIARLVGLDRVYGQWLLTQVLVFEPGVTIKGPTGQPVPLNPELGFPAVTVLGDPTVPAAPGAISDFCVPYKSDLVMFGLSRDNPCTGGLDTDGTRGNCPSEGDNVIENAGVPLFPCENGNNVDEDQDGKINDGCPQVNAEAETGGACDNALSDEPEDAAVNDGCPSVGDSEGDYLGSGCNNTNEGGCEARKNPSQAGTTPMTILTRSLRDADGDGTDNESDVCVLKWNAEWNPAAIPFDPANDWDGDGLPNACDPQPNDSCPRGISPPCNSNSPSGCEKGIVGPDYDQDCYSNRADNCPLANQLKDPSRPASFTQGNPQPSDNTPQLLDRDSDGIGDACDITSCPAEDTPAYLKADCELFGTSALGTSPDGQGSQDGRYRLDCLGFEVTVGAGANPRASGPTHDGPECLVVYAQPPPDNTGGDGVSSATPTPTSTSDATPTPVSASTPSPAPVEPAAASPTPVPTVLGATALPNTGGDGGGATPLLALGGMAVAAIGLVIGGVLVRRRLASTTVRRE
jgi:hypothetical protein